MEVVVVVVVEEEAAVVAAVAARHLAGAALGEVGEQPVGVVRRADVGVAALAQLDAALLAALLPVRPARVDRLVALLAEHRRRPERALLAEAARAHHPAAVVLHRLLLDPRRHHHVVHDLALVRHRVRAHHRPGAPVALRGDAGEAAARVDEEDGDAEAALEDVELGGGDDLDRLLRGREAAPRLLLAVLQRAPPLGVVVVVVVLLALRQLAAVLRVLRHLAGDGAHLGGGEAAAERQADRARLVGALAVVAHQPLRQRAARVGARVAGAALAGVVGDEGLGRRAVGHLALRVDALHHVRQHEEVLRLRLRGGGGRRRG